MVNTIIFLKRYSTHGFLFKQIYINKMSCLNLKDTGNHKFINSASLKKVPVPI